MGIIIIIKNKLHMASDNFKNKTLIGNWYECREEIPQMGKKLPEHRKTREDDPAISCLTSNGLPMNLHRMSRKIHHDSRGVIADDGFKEMNTINRTEIRIPTSIADIKHRENSKLILKENIAELSLVKRDVAGPQTGFGSKIAKHEDNYRQTYLETTNNNFLDQKDYGKKQHVNKVIADCEKKLETSSGGYKMDQTSSIKMSTSTIAEVYKKGMDPQDNTAVQRSWLWTHDPAIVAIETGKKMKVLEEDNETSLPLGRGEHFNKKAAGENKFGNKRMKTDVTSQLGQSCVTR